MDTDQADSLSMVYAGLNTLVYEIVAACADGSVLSYTEDGVVFEENKKEKEFFLKYIKPLQDDILVLFGKILDDLKLKAISLNDYRNDFMKIQSKLLINQY